jgi:TetR/AcrR family transcriptional regulator, tetracycline repressor protein
MRKSPSHGERSPRYATIARNAKLDQRDFPMLCEGGAILFDEFDRRYKEELELILCGAKTKITSGLE